MGSCFSCCNKKKTQSGGGNRGGLQEPLYTPNKRQSDDISLPQNGATSSTLKPYESPTVNGTIREDDDDVDVQISALDDANDTESFSDEAIPPMGARATLTGWLYHRTGTLFTSYQRAFFVLQEGYLYAYKRPKSDASSGEGSCTISYTLLLSPGSMLLYVFKHAVFADHNHNHHYSFHLALLRL
jgi:hypothetical protein